jgi:hypothetical protein
MSSRNNAVRYGTAWLVVLLTVGLIDYARLQGGSSHPEASSPAGVSPLGVPPAPHHVTPGPAKSGTASTPMAKRSQPPQSSPRLVAAKAAASSTGSAQVPDPPQPVEPAYRVASGPGEPPAPSRPWPAVAAGRVVSPTREAVRAPRTRYSGPLSGANWSWRPSEPARWDPESTMPIIPGGRTRVAVAPAINAPDQSGIRSQNGGF